MKQKVWSIVKVLWIIFVCLAEGSQLGALLLDDMVGGKGKDISRISLQSMGVLER